MSGGMTKFGALTTALLAETPRRYWLFTAFTAVVFALCHLTLPFNTFPDTITYVYLRDHLGEPDIWKKFMLIRPALYPLVLRWLSDPVWLSCVQAAVSFAAWVTLARVVSRRFSRPELRSLAYYLMVWGALGSNILFWNRVMLTESFTLSALCLFLAGWLLALERGRVLLLVVSGLALLFLRDTMIYLVVPFAASALLWRRSAALGAGVIVLILATTVAATLADMGQRYKMPLANSIQQRILTNEKTLAFFAARGLPVSDELKKCTGLFDCPLPPEVMAWIVRDGKAAYQSWLIQTFPRRVIQQIQDREHTAPGLLTRGYLPISRPWFNALTAIPPLPTPRFWAESLVIVLALIGFRLRQYRRWSDLVTPQEWVWLVMLAFALSNLFICYWGDAMETKRHSLPAMLMVQIALTGLVFALVEAARTVSHPPNLRPSADPAR